MLTKLLRKWFPPRARLMPFVPGGPLDVENIVVLYRALREWGNPPLRALRGAIGIEWAAWRYSRALQSEEVVHGD